MEFGKGRLKGIEVIIYQGMDGGWNASVLLEKSRWGCGTGFYGEPTHLPRRGNRPLTDQGSGRWWYDEGFGLNVFVGKHHPNFGMKGEKRNPDEALALLRLRVTTLVTEILETKKKRDNVTFWKVGEAVHSLPVTKHPKWS